MKSITYHTSVSLCSTHLGILVAIPRHCFSCCAFQWEGSGYRVQCQESLNFSNEKLPNNVPLLAWMKNMTWGKQRRGLEQVSGDSWLEWEAAGIRSKWISSCNWSIQCCSWEKDSCGKQLILEGREGNFEGLTSGAGSVCDETPRTTAEEGNHKVYLCRYRSRFFFLNCDHKQRKKD